MILDEQRTERQDGLIQKWIKHFKAKGTVMAATGFGKAQPVSEKVFTKEGKKRIGDIEIGDKVIGSSGVETKVRGVYPQGKKKIYRLTFDDSSSVRATGDHLWSVQTKYDKYKNKGFKAKRTKDLIEDLQLKSGDKKWFLPIVSPVNFSKRDLFIHPYILGFLLGDGCFRRNRGTSFSTADEEIIEEILPEYLPDRVSFSKIGKYDYLFTHDGESCIISHLLKHMGLYGLKSENKFIPKSYLFSSVKQRVNLLRGLMDSDGWCRESNGHCAFSSSSKKLAEGVCELVRSLGGITKVDNLGLKKGASGNHYKVVVNLKGINPFYLTRKRDNYNLDSKQGQTKSIISIEECGVEESVCISVEAKDNLYLTSGYTLTHNTYLAIRAIKRLRRKWSKAPVTIIVPTQYLKDQWLENLGEHDVKNPVKVEVINGFVYKYLEKRKKTKATLLILDEVHAYTGDIFRKVFDAVEYRFLLGLTATMDEEDKKYDIIRSKAPVVGEVTLAECRRNDWVADFLVFNLGIEMTPSERREYDSMEEDYHKYFSTFGHDFNLAMKCLKNDKAQRSLAKELNYDQEVIKIHAINWMRNMKKRKSFLYELPSKLEKAREIFEHFPNENIVTFCQSTDFADRIAEIGGSEAMAYHSNVKGRNIDGEYHGQKRTKQYALDSFNSENGDVRIISSVSALDTGMDIPKIDVTASFSGTSSALQGTQRVGRPLRGDRAIIIEVYALDSQDEYWLRKRQKNIPRQTINRITEINQIPKV